MPIHAPTRIKELRTKAGLSVRELAARLGLTQPNVSKIENGRISVSLDLLYKIADILHVQVLDLLDGELSSRTQFAPVRGALWDDGPSDRVYQPPFELVAVPMTLKLPAPIEAFEIEDGFVYAHRHFPNFEDHLANFVIQYSKADGQKRIERRQFERSDLTSGFFTDTGAPADRWMPAGAESIDAIWRLIGEYRAA